jgi:hypothetical protein
VAGEILLAHLRDDPRPFFDVQIEAVAPTGVARPVAMFRDIHPAGWTDANPMYGTPVSIGPGDQLLVVAERNGGVEPGDAAALLLDLRDPSAPPVEIAAVPHRPVWGPTGALAWSGNGWQVADGRTGIVSGPDLPAGVEPGGAWLADGSGWLAMRHGDDQTGPEVGWLSTTGMFTPGTPRTFEWTGLERRLGATGGTLWMAVSDGVESSETVLVERRADLPGACHCLAWVRMTEPGDDPRFGDAIWDAAGTGVWVPMAEHDGEERWLSHVTEPTVDSRVADLPDNGDWRIVAISPDDHWVVLAGEEAGEIVLVDSLAGEVVAGARNGEVTAVEFAGWVR